MTSAKPRKREGLRRQLLDLIVSGGLAAGEKLNEVDLARRLKASRTPLREAMLHLEREGLIRSDLRRGFTVETLSVREMRETYPLLAQLECFAVRSSATLLPLVLPQVARVNERFRKARTPSQARDLDTLWHDTLMSQCKNSRVTKLVQGLRLSIARYERIYMTDAALIAISAGQHDAIAATLKNGDLDRGLDLLNENYRFGMQALLRRMDEE
jgi:DNA-binding GntR family transcriptional regulator